MDTTEPARFNNTQCSKNNLNTKDDHHVGLLIYGFLNVCVHLIIWPKIDTHIHIAVTTYSAVLHPRSHHPRFYIFFLFSSMAGMLLNYRLENAIVSILVLLFSGWDPFWAQHGPRRVKLLVCKRRGPVDLEMFIINCYYYYIHYMTCR